MTNCHFCHTSIARSVDGTGWVDRTESVLCDNPTNMHHPSGEAAEAAAEAAFATRAEITHLTLPPNTVMFVVALTSGEYYSSLSRIIPDAMPKEHAIRMLRSIAAGWEQELIEEIAQTN